MFISRLVCFTSLANFALGDPMLEGRRQIRPRQGGYGYGYGWPFPPFPVSASTSGDPTATETASLSTGSISGTAAGTISASGLTSVPYGNFTTSLSGTAYSTGGITYTFNDPNANSVTVSGRPSPSSNATTGSTSSYTVSSATISANSVTASNITDPGYPYPTHGPYPFPTYKKPTLLTGTLGTSLSQSATGVANLTSVSPTDPSPSRPYPTHGPYTRSWSLSPYSYSASSIVGTTVTAISSFDPSATFTISPNATSIPAASGTAISYGTSPSADPTISEKATSVTTPAGTGPTVFSTSDPYTSGSGTGTGYSFSTTAGATTLGTGTGFTYTPTIRSQPSEYYYHHRRSRHNNRVSLFLNLVMTLAWLNNVQNQGYEDDGYGYDLGAGDYYRLE